MNRFSLFILTLILSVFSVLRAKAQDNPIGPEFLGVWCIIDIDLTNDPVNERGELVYEIADPPEGAGLMGYGNGDMNGDYDDWIDYGNIPLTGPGSPYVIKNGNNLEIHFKRVLLKLEMLDDTAIFDCGLPVKKKVVIIASRPVSYQQCYYTVRLVVKN